MNYTVVDAVVAVHWVVAVAVAVVGKAVGGVVVAVAVLEGVGARESSRIVFFGGGRGIDSPINFLKRLWSGETSGWPNVCIKVSTPTFTCVVVFPLVGCLKIPLHNPF